MSEPTQDAARVAHAAPVLTVVVTRGLTDYLPATLAALATQTVTPDVLVVDASADPRVADVVGEALAGHPGRLALVAAPESRNLGDAVRAGLANVGTAGTDGLAAHPWLWLLHDDSAPAPDALAALLRAVEVAPSVAVAGCKQLSWSDADVLLEVGVTTSRFGRRMTGLDDGEVDQGQHDGREDVLAVGTAGALVRRDAWEALGGPDPALGPYGDGLDLCRRARLAGHRVVVVPAAAVRHAQASLGLDGHARPGWDARRSAQHRREAFLHSQLVGVPAAAAPAVAVLGVLSGLVRAAGRLVVKEPHLLVAELVAPWAVLLRPGRVARARRDARRTAVLRRSALRPLQRTWRDVARHHRDTRLAAAERRRVERAPSELELRELGALRSRRRAGLAALAVAAGVLTLVGVPVVGQALTGARLAGGGLPWADAGLMATWQAATSWWAASGFGDAAPPEPLLLVLLPLVAATGSLAAAVQVLVLASPLLSALGAWAAAGAATRSVALRLWAALIWTAAPTLLLALDTVRPGAVIAHVTLPWLALGTARAVGAARVDVVRSGLDDADFVAGPAPAVARPAPSGTAEPSFAAAGGAGLAACVVVAAAPALLPVLVLALLGVAVLRPRRRLAWVLVPPLVVAAPALVASGTWSSGGWRAILLDPGLVVAADAAPAWQQLLGWPQSPDLAAPWGAVAVATGGAVLLAAAVALVVRPPAVRAVRLGWWLVALGVAAAALVAAVPAAVSTSGTVTAGWTGPSADVALLGATLAALVGAGRLRGGLRSASFGWRQLTAGLLAALAVAGPVTVLVAWVARTDGPGLTAAEHVVPAVGTQLQGSPDRGRVLLLGPGDPLTATVLRGDGVQLTEVSRLVAARSVGTSVLGGAGEPAELDAADAELADVAARLAAGVGEPADQLAELGVAAVLVPAGDPATTAIVGTLDSTPGLERVTQTAAGVIWRVAVDGTVAWARLTSGTAGLDGAPAPDTAVAADVMAVDTRIPAGADDRLLVLAERADPGWRAFLDGRPLRAVENGWRQTFEVGADGGRLTVGHEPPERRPWLAVQLVVLAATVLLAIPVRRRRVR